MSVATLPIPTAPSRTPPPVGVPSVTPPRAPGGPSNAPFQTPVSYRLWSVAEYERMVAVGLLEEDEPIELLEGYLVKKMPRNNPHDNGIRTLTSRLIRAVPMAWTVQCQCAVVFDESKPEPDFSVVRGDEKKYQKRQPRSADVALMIEVCDSNLARDRIDKGRIYARAGIPVYWVVNVTDQQIEIFSDPTGPDDEPRYKAQTTFAKGMTVPLVLDGNEVGSFAVDEIV